MALLKLSGMATAISGKLGGSIFATTGNGSVMKQNSYSQQHATPLQSVNRSRLYPVTQLWRSLSDSERLLWNAETVNYPYTNRVGDIVYYTGYQLFNLLNQGRRLIGEPVLTSPPTFVTPVPCVLGAIDYSFILKQINKTGGDSGMNALFYFTAPRKTALAPKNSEYQYIHHMPVVVASATFAIGFPYNSRFGNSPVGTYVGCKIKFMVRSTGYATDFIDAGYDVVT